MKFYKGFTPWNLGKKATEDAKKNQSIAHLGQKAWNKIEFTQDQQKQICDLYTVNNLSCVEIGNIYHVREYVIRRILKSNNIKIRTNSETHKGLKSSRKGKSKVPKDQQKEICKMYESGNNRIIISKKFNISDSTILKILKNNNVKLRSITEAHTKVTKEMEKEICKLYLKGLTAKEVGQKYNLSFMPIRRILKKYGIHRNKSQSLKEKYCGELASNWKGGVSFLPYCPKFDNKKREEIREKYYRKCIICSKDEKDNIITRGKHKDETRRLHVHHIDYNKLQGCAGHKWKLAPLCSICHSRTNRNRKEWETKISELTFVHDKIENLLQMFQNIEDISILCKNPQ